MISRFGNNNYIAYGLLGAVTVRLDTASLHAYWRAVCVRASGYDKIFRHARNFDMRPRITHLRHCTEEAKNGI